MFLGSQLTEISSRFSAHVQDIRDFLLKEKLPVPSPDAIPEISSRLGSDARFRADLGSLLRVTLYQEREGIGYEDLLAILVAAAAGTEHDLKSDLQEADIREMLRFVLQSRRSTFRPEPEEPRVEVEPETREPIAVDSEPVLRARGTQLAGRSMKLELRSADDPVAVAEAERPEAGDVGLPLFRTTGLFGAQAEPEPSWWSRHSVWAVGVVCMLLGLGLGLTFHRVVSAAETHIAIHTANTSASKPKVTTSVAPEQSASGSADALVTRKASPEPVVPSGTRQTTPVAEREGTPVQPAATMEGRSVPPPVIAQAGPGMPVTVVKQEVTSTPETEDPADATEATAKTRSIVHPGSAGMTAANVIFSPAPEYPAAAAAARVHGQVTVHAVVDPEGKVIYARAVSGPPELRDAAKQAVRRWRYSPLLENGKPIAVTTTAILDFKFAK